MKPARLASLAAVAAAALWLASAAFTQDQGGNMDDQGMKRWMEACTPGPQHKELARFLGKWDTATTVTGMGGAEKGSAEGRWLVEGRWVVVEGTGPMMGMPGTGFATMGYDNFKRKYVSSFVDSRTTTLLTSDGNFDQSKSALITYGLMDEPMDGTHDKTVKYVWRFHGADKMSFEVHDMAIGETNTKVVEVVYTRRK